MTHRLLLPVIAGLDPAIRLYGHPCAFEADGRLKAGHDGEEPIRHSSCELVLGLAFAAILFALPVLGQTQATTARGYVSVPVGEGRLFQLDQDATDVLVADSSIADVHVVTPRMIYVYGRRIGETTLHATGGNNVEASLVIRVSRSAAAAQSSIPPPAPPAQLGQSGPVSLRFLGDRLEVQGPVNDLGQAMEVQAAARGYANGSRLLDRTRLAGAQQITVRVRFAEVSRNDLNRLGINWNVVANPGNFALSLLTGNALNSLNLSETFGTASVGYQDSTVNAEALINALAREGVLTLLAEPNLTTLSGETASFLAGGEIPIPVPQAYNVTTIEYKPFGVSLSFTPVLLPDNRIAMKVKPEVSELSNQNMLTINNYQVPSFTTRRAETNVEMASGQTLAMAGLFQRRLQDDIDRIPGIGDLPVLGALFRSTRFQRDETELVILITPYLAQPSASPNTPLPTEDVSALRRGTPGDVGFVAN